MNTKSPTSLVKFFISAVLFLATVLGLAIPMQTVRAATITVCASGCDYTTIQAAITAAVAGDTINVAAGTYGGQIIVNKSVTILGDPGDASPGPGPSAPIIDGGSAAGDAFLIANGVSNVTIQGFEIRNFTSNATGIGNGISAWEASTSNITIQDNYFHNLGWNGVLAGNDGALGDHTNWTIKGNILETFVAYGFELTNTSNSSIENNVIHSDAISDPGTCIMVDARRNETGITLKNNQIDGPMPTGIAAVFIFADSFETPNANLNNVLVEGNTISTIGTMQNDFSFENSHEFTNRIWVLRKSYAGGATPHVWMYNYAGTGTVTGVQAHKNNLSSLKTNTPAQVDATLNWWGDLDPSDNVVGNVNYSPWCIDASCTTFAPPFATLTTITADTPDPSALGQTVTVTASVAGLPAGAPMPTGSVTISGGVADCTINLVGGTGSCGMTFNTDGAKTITATYNPDTAGFSTSSDTESHTVDGTAPIVVSSVRVNASPTAAASVDFTVTFSEPVTGVDMVGPTFDDFSLTTSSGISGASVTTVSGSGTTYTVTANTGSGNGTLRLDVGAAGSIVDAALNPLAGGFTTGQIYSVIKSATFADVPLDYWANSFIERLYILGITSGCGVSPLTYCPDQIVTRAEMAIFLLRGMHGSTYSPPAVGTGTGFSDVAITHWAAAWIKQLAAEGITSGCGSGNYCPEASVTRDQMAVILLRAKYGSTYSPPPATGVFADVPTTHWAAAWIEQLAAEGITGGCGTDTYCPNVAVTRAQIAVFLVRTFNLP